MRAKVPTLSTELYHRLHQALTECEEFDNHQRLCEFIAEGELAVYQPWFLKNDCASKAERIEKAINYLRRQSLQGRQLALPLFLLALRGTLLEGDALIDELDELTSKVVSELEGVMPSHRMLPLTLETRDFSTPPPRMYDDTLFASATKTITDEPLNFKDREWIIEIVNTIIDPMGPDGRKNLLRPCNFPENIIDSINYDKGTRLVAEAMVGLVERRDKLNSDICYLEVFLNSMIEMDSSIGGTTRSKLSDIITVYNQSRARMFESINSHNGTILHKNISLVEGQIPHSLEDHIMQGLQQARKHYQTKPGLSQYKIDAGTIIQCNLNKQKVSFWQGFGGRYKGTFTFTVASIDRRILKEYVIEGLIWELKQHIRRPMAPVRHVYLSLENLACSSSEQGVTTLYKEIEQQLSIQSITDLLAEDQETNVVIVVWHKDIPLDSLRLIALRFSETLNERVKDILFQQGRCLVLLWATYGFPSIESLDIPIALPVFERFELDHLSEWLEYEVSTQLRNQNVPEQEIRYCWERIVMKIKHFEGRLPETYEVLRESLELGGVL